jgi:3-deoxy-D-manno-octulosonic-acid transferase
MERSIRRFYSLLMWLAQPLLRRKLVRRGRAEAGYLDAVDERFGHYAQPAETRPELVWVHAVSLGETRTAAILLQALRAQSPGLRVLLTHGTATGRAEGKGLLREGDVQAWQPWDNRASVRRFFAHFKPRLGLLMETEVWPNTVAIAKAQAVPLVLVNARMSGKSLQQALRMGPLSRPAYETLSAVYAQSERDATRLQELGAPVRGVFGNLKFDATPDAAQLEKGHAWRQALARPVLMFASSREGEETEFLKQISALAQALPAQSAMNSGADQSRPKFKPLIVPRHPQRFDDVAALVAARGLTLQRRSGLTNQAVSSQVLLGDSMGEMFAYYVACDLAFIGGSLLPLGGQNLIEACALGKPVLIGPHTFNFALATQQAIEAGGAMCVADAPELVAKASELLVDDATRGAMGEQALAFAEHHRGATARTVGLLRHMIF